MKYTQRRKLKQNIRQEREIKDIRQVKKQLREEIKSGQKNKMQQKEDRSENEAWGGDETFYFDLTSSVNLNESHWNRYSTLALALSAWATNRLSTCCSKQNKLFKLFIELHPGEGCSWRGHLETSLHGHRSGGFHRGEIVQLVWDFCGFVFPVITGWTPDILSVLLDMCIW